MSENENTRSGQPEDATDALDADPPLISGDREIGDDNVVALDGPEFFYRGEVLLVGSTMELTFSIPWSVGSHQVWMNLRAGSIVIKPILVGVFFKGQQWHSIDVTEIDVLADNIVGQWRLNSSWSASTQQKIIVREPAAFDPVSIVTDVVEGTARYGSHIQLQQPGSGVPLSNSVQAGPNDRWRVTLLPSVAPGAQDFIIREDLAGTRGRYTESKTLTVFRPPVIDSPANNAVIPSGSTILLEGVGVPGQFIDIMTPGGDFLHGQALVKPDRSWQVPFNQANYPNGGIIKMTAAHRGAHDWSEMQSFTLLGKPTIDTPSDGAVIDVRGEISGNSAVGNGIVEVLKEFDHQVKIGEGNVEANGKWRVTRFDSDMRPGSFAIVARQTLGGVRSPVSEYRAFNVRPPTVVLQKPTAETNGTVTITGTGYVSAGLDIHYTGDSNVLLTFKVTIENWTRQIDNWLPGAFSIYARQWVPGLRDEKIYSAPSPAVTFTVKVPPPTLRHHVGSDQIPEFSGYGNSWADHAPARVELRITGSNPTLPSLPIVAVGNGNLWSNRASEAWDPGTYSVEARQLFKPNEKDELQSDWITPVHVVIKAPLPSIDAITENGLSPDIAGTCWIGAVVTLTFSDSATPYSVPDTDKKGQWVYRRPTPFTPGSYTVKATQTFGGQTSNEVTRSFTVAVPKPVIKPMTPPVGHEPIIEGSGGYVDAVMTIYDYLTVQELGHEPVSGDTWSVLLQRLEFRPYQIYAVQSVNGRASEKSELIRFDVELLPPIVDTPQHQDKVARSFRIEGRASRAIGLDMAQVQVWLDEGTEPWDTVRANDRGEFWFNATLPLGTHTLRFKQLIKDEVSAFGEDLLVTVVPAQPVFETPASGEAVESSLAISGLGYPGDTVSVAFADDIQEVLGSTQVEDNGTWTLWLLLDRPAGHPSLVVQQSVGEYLSGWTVPRPVELRTQPPSFTAPLPGRWVERRPAFAGTASLGGGIKLFDWSNPDICLATAGAVDGIWNRTLPRNLSPRDHWVCAVQVDSPEGKKQVSATTDSARFEVKADNQNGVDPTR